MTRAQDDLRETMNRRDAQGLGEVLGDRRPGGWTPADELWVDAHKLTLPPTPWISFPRRPPSSSTDAAPKENVQLPNHYRRWKMEPIRFIVENRGPGFLVDNATKYAWRYDAKNGHEDLAKLARYVEMLRRYEAGDPLWADPASTFDLTPWNQKDQPLRSLGDKAPDHGQ